MTSYRDQDRNARDYCEMLELDPDEVVGGYYQAGNGTKEWIKAPRWHFYLNANLAQDRPLSGYQKLLAEQQAKRDAALAKVGPQRSTQPSAFTQVPSPVVPGVSVIHGIPTASLQAAQSR